MRVTTAAECSEQENNVPRSIRVSIQKRAVPRESRRASHFPLSAWPVRFVVDFHEIKNFKNNAKHAVKRREK